MHQLVKNLPLSAILPESDAPDQPGEGHRGERNEPSYLPEVPKTVSRLRGESPETIAAQTGTNTRKRFRLGE